jgi:hypothetical protein
MNAALDFNGLTEDNVSVALSENFCSNHCIDLSELECPQ